MASIICLAGCLQQRAAEAPVWLLKVDMTGQTHVWAKAPIGSDPDGQAVASKEFSFNIKNFDTPCNIERAEICITFSEWQQYRTECDGRVNCILMDEWGPNTRPSIIGSSCNIPYIDLKVLINAAVIPTWCHDTSTRMEVDNISLYSWSEIINDPIYNKLGWSVISRIDTSNQTATEVAFHSGEAFSSRTWNIARLVSLSCATQQLKQFDIANARISSINDQLEQEIENLHVSINGRYGSEMPNANYVWERNNGLLKIASMLTGWNCK